jgi:hypothetical protein
MGILYMKAVKVDEAHRIRLVALKPGDSYEPEIHGPADEITLCRLRPSRRKMTKAEAIRRIKNSKLVFKGSWDEIRKDTREP